MQEVKVQVEHDDYETIEIEENIIVYNPIYERKIGFFLLYIILTFFDSPSYRFLHIPRSFIIHKQASFITISKDLSIKTDGTYDIIYEKRAINRWLFGVAFPMLILFLFFLFLLVLTGGLLIKSNISIQAIVLFTVFLIITLLGAFTNLILFKNWRSYKNQSSGTQ